MATQDLSAEQAKGNTRTNPFGGFHSQDTTGSSPQVQEALEITQERLIMEVEVLTFLAEILDGGDAHLELSTEARYGLSNLLGMVAASVDSIAGEVDRAKGMLPGTETAQ